MSRALHVQVDVLGLAEEAVYLLHGAERTHLLLGALGHDPPGCARRPPRPRVHDVRVSLRVDRARSQRRRTKHPQGRADFRPARLRPTTMIAQIVPRGLQLRVLEVYVRVPLGIDRRPPAVRYLLAGQDCLNGSLGLRGAVDGTLRFVRGWLDSGSMGRRDGKPGVDGPVGSAAVV